METLYSHLKLWGFWVPTRYKLKGKWKVEIFMYNDYLYVSELFLSIVTVNSGLLMASLRYLGRPKHVSQLEDHG